MISLNQLSMAFGQKLLFYSVNLNLIPGQCYALVGANGTGKSTFFKLLMKEEESTSGDILIPKDANVGWLKQDQFRYEESIISNIVLEGKPLLWKAMEEKEALLNSSEWTDAIGYRLAQLEEVIANHQGYEAQAQAERILSGLGIPEDYIHKPLKALSGGYKLRVLLAQTLFQNPEILLLDEPTNHLDIVSIRWLEKFLKQEFKGLVIFISHDVEFINNLSDSILDIDYAEIRQYPGKYDKFLADKQLVEEQKSAEKKSLENRIAEMQKFVDKFKAKASKASQARSRMKMIEKITVPDLIQSSRTAPHFQFLMKRPSGKIVYKLSGISKAFKGKQLFNKFNLEITRGDRLGILGVNGIGKSSLMKLLVQSLTPDEGTLTPGHEVHMSYFSQDHHELLNHSISALQWLKEVAMGSSEQQVRKVLGQLLFSQEDVNKNILSISGGEAARLLLAKVMLENPNVILLDEPTNHMDLESIDALIKALQQYTGTVIFVSHNRHFVNQVANRILYLTPDNPPKDFKGKYIEFSKEYDLG